MESRLIKILDSGKVELPTTIAMRDFEIANLLGVSYALVRGRIKSLLKERRFHDCIYNVVSGNSLISDTFGLDIVIAIAFHIDSYEADLFCKWVMRKIMQENID